VTILYLVPFPKQSVSNNGVISKCGLGITQGRCTIRRTARVRFPIRRVIHFHCYCAWSAEIYLFPEMRQMLPHFLAGLASWEKNLQGSILETSIK